MGIDTEQKGRIMAGQNDKAENYWDTFMRDSEHERRRETTPNESGQERSAGRPGPQRVEWNRGDTNDLSGSVAIVGAAGRDVPRSVPVRRSQPPFVKPMLLSLGYSKG